MPSNFVLHAGRLSLLGVLGCALPLACFDPSEHVGVAEDTGGTETTDTGELCEIATEACPCTGGGGCNPGLECSNGVCEPIQPVCGNGMVELGEACDDADDDDTNSCTSLCQPPSCSDGIVSGDEVDVDCGVEACEIGCDFGQACLTVADCLFPSCGPAGAEPEPLVCELPTSCAAWLAHDPMARDGEIEIDPDGAAGPLAPAQVFCHMSKDGGGWTLVMVSSDDDVDTWTWNNRAGLTGEAEPLGQLSALNLDFMSPAYTDLPFTDVLFIHQPSTVWAHYANVGDGTASMSAVMAGFASPICDPSLGGNGYEMVGGTLTATGKLCDTDLYFNLGDHDSTLDECMDFGAPSNSAAFGPVWSGDNGAGCPFDDPAQFGLGPEGPCEFCQPPSTEQPTVGFANALGLNTGTKKLGENYMQMYVR